MELQKYFRQLIYLCQKIEERIFPSVKDQSVRYRSTISVTLMISLGYPEPNLHDRYQFYLDQPRNSTNFAPKLIARVLNSWFIYKLIIPYVCPLIGMVTLDLIMPIKVKCLFEKN